MANSSQQMAGPRAVPEGDARKIVAECRKCIEEDVDRLGSCARMRMLAIQRAMEATADLPCGFGLNSINEQIRHIANGVENVPADVENAAMRTDLTVTDDHRRSFFTSYISGKKKDGKMRRFNTYVRAACRRLGLGYSAVIGGSPDGNYTYYYLKYARDEAERPEPIADVEGLTANIAESSAVLSVCSARRQRFRLLTANLTESAAVLARRGRSEDVGELYREARAVSEKIAVRGHPGIDRLRFEIATGLWSYYLVHGNLEAAGAEAARLAEIAARVDDRSMRVLTLRAAGTTALWLGRFADAERELRKCLEELGDGSGYRPFASDLGASPFSLVASELASAMVVLGRHQEALETVRRAREYLAGKNDPFHDCFALTFSSWIKLEIGELAGAAADAGELLRHATHSGLAALRGLGTALDGIIRAFLADDPKDGVGDVYRGLGEWQASGSALFVSSLLTKAGEVWLRAGNARQAEQALKEAFEFAEKTGDGFYVAEIHRLRGDIQWICHKNFAAAENNLRRALQISSDQRSLTYRLRATTSLLQMAQERNGLPDDCKAREIAGQSKLLRELLTEFKQEPDSADLQFARALLLRTEVRRRRSKIADRPGATRRSQSRTRRTN